MIKNLLQVYLTVLENAPRVIETIKIIWFDLSYYAIMATNYKNLHSNYTLLNGTNDLLLLNTVQQLNKYANTGRERLILTRLIRSST